MTGRRSVADALDTRVAILRRAADIASVEGLEGLTIGRLAADLEMSKSGVIGHFGTKEQLQLATLDHAADLFRQRVWEPVRHLRPGLERLLGICASWTRYAEAPGFAGGCFIAETSFEWDGRIGPVHDALVVVTGRWRRTLAAEIRTAIAAGELAADLDPDQAVFGLEALAAGINPARQLHGETQAPTWALRTMHAILGVSPAPAR
ncbi:TetR/AcrR family transcriptional regulator [Pseudofrankia asymbiotica]|uniref:TetR family transcriptional regulator n=1 Tax=Pseudofrankia asymbiotica TaxID=1834516 RepID=A0A1V2IAX9_9ACTN|nr:TetR/AcrR family transcriptional regulator [Pseudofrankia asymbiotica]ONH29741.1 TetR family transcriptional regulator [Pseudofrankia asymbiotica]